MSKNKSNNFFGPLLAITSLSVLLTYQLVYASAPGVITVYSQTGTVTEGTAGSVTYQLKLLNHGNNPSLCETNQGDNGEGNVQVNLGLLFTNTASTSGITLNFNPTTPVGITGSFGCTVLTLNVPSTFAAGSYDFTVTGSGENSGNLNNISGNGTLLVGAAPVPEFTPVTISGRVFNDLNSDRDDELGTDPSLEGWTISAYPIISSETDTRSTTTVISTSTGYYFSFGASDVGQWKIVETVQDGWTRTLPDESEGYTFNVATSSESAVNRHFGNYKAPVLEVMKFNDLNKNGVKDQGEPAIANWPFVLAVQEDWESESEYLSILEQPQPLIL